MESGDRVIQHDSLPSNPKPFLNGGIRRRIVEVRK